MERLTQLLNENMAGVLIFLAIVSFPCLYSYLKDIQYDNEDWKESW